MKVTHAGRQITVTVRADGDGLVSHAGSASLGQVADKTGLTRALNETVGEPGLRAGSHERGWVIRDLAVMLAEHIATIEILLRVDSAGAGHELWAGAARARSVLGRV